MESLAEFPRFLELWTRAKVLAGGTEPMWGMGDVAAGARRPYAAAAERDLSCLDEDQWHEFCDRVAPLLVTSNGIRKWQGAFDQLNEAAAYAFLRRRYQVRPEFVQRQSVRSPDIEVLVNNALIVCESKTINLSNDQLAFHGSGGVKNSYEHLPDGFFRGLDGHLESAAQQMSVHRPEVLERVEIVFITVNFDDQAPEYNSAFWQQIDRYFRCRLPSSLNLVAREPLYNPESYRVWSQSGALS